MSENKNIFTHRVWVPLLSLTCAVLWGWAFPLLKLGFAEFGITAEMTASKMVYAGLRFTFAGLLILIIAAILRKDFRLRRVYAGKGQLESGLYILAFALMNTTLQYAFF